MGFDFYRQSVPENEQKLLTTLYADALSFWNTHSSFKPDNYILSCNFHISNGKIKKLINHKIFPVYFDEDNKCKQLACILSLPSSFTFRNIVMCKKKAEHYWEYTPCSTSQLWRKIKRSVLSDAEKDILALANMGYSAKEMSEYLSRSESCIKVRKDKIFQKLGAKNMQEAIAIATAHLYM
ncbi:MAG: helix-turn-helix transcriptional regulator [Tannerellaceae bacterium]|nr:helix-turn-helix transcriptional regulator [Tannerellaceae bacterium]